MSTTPSTSTIPEDVRGNEDIRPYFCFLRNSESLDFVIKAQLIPARNINKRKRKREGAPEAGMRYTAARKLVIAEMMSDSLRKRVLVVNILGTSLWSDMTLPPGVDERRMPGISIWWPGPHSFHHTLVLPFDIPDGGWINSLSEESVILSSLRNISKAIGTAAPATSGLDALQRRLGRCFGMLSAEGTRCLRMTEYQVMDTNKISKWPSRHACVVEISFNTPDGPFYGSWTSTDWEATSAAEARDRLCAAISQQGQVPNSPGCDLWRTLDKYKSPLSWSLLHPEPPQSSCPTSTVRAPLHLPAATRPCSVLLKLLAQNSEHIRFRFAAAIEQGADVVNFPTLSPSHPPLPLRLANETVHILPTSARACVAEESNKTLKMTLTVSCETISWSFTSPKWDYQTWAEAQDGAVHLAFSEGLLHHLERQLGNAFVNPISSAPSSTQPNLAWEIPSQILEALELPTAEGADEWFHVSMTPASPSSENHANESFTESAFMPPDDSVHHEEEWRGQETESWSSENDGRLQVNGKLVDRGLALTPYPTYQRNESPFLASSSRADWSTIGLYKLSAPAMSTIQEARWPLLRLVSPWIQGSTLLDSYYVNNELEQILSHYEGVRCLRLISEPYMPLIQFKPYWQPFAPFKDSLARLYLREIELEAGRPFLSGLSCSECLVVGAFLRVNSDVYKLPCLATR